MSFESIPFGIIAGIVAGIVAIVWAINWWQSRGERARDAFVVPETPTEGADATKPPTKAVLCRVADSINLKIYNTMVEGVIIDAVIAEYKSLGRMWDRYGQRVYGLRKFLDGETVKYAPIMEPETSGNGPSVLYSDMQQPEIDIIGEGLRSDDEKGFMDKYGTWLLWISGMAFLAWLWTQS